METIKEIDWISSAFVGKMKETKECHPLKQENWKSTAAVVVVDVVVVAIAIVFVVVVVSVSAK